MKHLLFFALLLLSLTAFAQMPDRGIMTLKGGHAVVDGQKIKDKATLISLLGEDLYQNGWKPASRMRSAGMGLTIAGGIVLGYGLTGYTVAICTDWPEEEIDPERYSQFLMAFNATKLICLTGAVTLGAGIPLLIIGNNRLRGVCEQYNLTVSTAPGGLALTFRF